jgi:hypothetical protein
MANFDAHLKTIVIEFLRSDSINLNFFGAWFNSLGHPTNDGFEHVFAPKRFTAPEAFVQAPDVTTRQAWPRLAGPFFKPPYCLSGVFSLFLRRQECAMVHLTGHALRPVFQHGAPRCNQRHIQRCVSWPLPLLLRPQWRHRRV